jgi:hypothetical protein
MHTLWAACPFKEQFPGHEEPESIIDTRLVLVQR